MNELRKAQLEKWRAEDPSDPFPLYALALEWKEANSAQALAYLEELLASFADYLPAYYQAAVLYYENNQPEKAREVARAGAALAEARGERKVKGELLLLLDE